MGCFCLAVLIFRFSAEKHCFVLIAHCSQFCSMDCQGDCLGDETGLRMCHIVVTFHLNFFVGSTLVHVTC